MPNRDNFKIMRFIFLLSLSVFALAACESRPINTSQPLAVDVIGADKAYCILSTKYNRYALFAPDTAVVERSPEEMKIDCKASMDRRRIVVLQSEFDELYYRYPDKVTVDFSDMDTGTRYNGFRAQPSEFDTMVREVITEDSFVNPVDTSQTYPVEKNYRMGKRSYPVALQ